MMKKNCLWIVFPLSILLWTCQRESNNAQNQNKIVLSVSIKANEEDVRKYVKNTPFSSKVLLANESIQKIYNLQVITPMMYVIDRKGIIKFKGAGASILKIIEKVLEKLITSG